jgi:hypothetical protein
MSIWFVTTCSILVIITRTEYYFASQQYMVSMRKRAEFRSRKRICELIWESENDGAGGIKRHHNLFILTIPFYVFLNNRWNNHVLLIPWVEILEYPLRKTYWKR